MNDLTLPTVSAPSSLALEQAWRVLDDKTKPARSLGRLEEVAARWAALGHAAPRPTVVVAAADHGVAEEGVSAFPQAVTRQMLLNFARGGAAINALCNAAGANLVVIDVGTLGPTPAGVLDGKVREGSRNLAREAALTAAEVRAAVKRGCDLGLDLARQGVNIVGLGEMGIGNSTVAAVLTAAFTQNTPRSVVGRGTGIDDPTLARKVSVVERALALHTPDPSNPWRVLEQLGGLEVCALCGVAIGAASRGLAVLMDGFISSAAMLPAVALQPALAGYLFASHVSREPGHALVLRALGQRPMLDLELRLGEGSGAALSLPLFEAAHRVYSEMATFEGAEVSRRDD